MCTENFYVLSFDSTSHAIQTEKKVIGRFEFNIMPTPREISHHCGLSIKIAAAEIDEILEFINEIAIPCHLYRVTNNSTKREREFMQIR